LTFSIIFSAFDFSFFVHVAATTACITGKPVVAVKLVKHANAI